MAATASIESVERTGIERDRVLVYPTYAHLSANGATWVIHIQGQVLAPQPDNLRRRMLMRVLGRMMRASAEELQSEIFRHRVAGFLTRGHRGRRVTVSVAHRLAPPLEGDILPLNGTPHSGNGDVHDRGPNGVAPIVYSYHATRRGGHFRGAFQLPVHDVSRYGGFAKDHQNWLNLAVRTFDESNSEAIGEVCLIDDIGVSVISDIDDTLKNSNVARKRSLLLNTFLRPYHEVPGMVSLYRNWSDEGAAFHFVSASPWQLYHPLRQWFEETGIPRGTFHLRSIRLQGPSLVQLLVNAKRAKKRAIKSILRSFPRRRFILVGDAGEKDPEIYGAIARRHSSQIAAICIRKLAHKPFGGKRLAKAFHRVPSRLCHVFEKPEEIADLVRMAGGVRS
ncbi:MAG: App1 family protein [Pirellulaceae bacterium]|nr:App1 family protein [Planctomycetales bacterium]